MNKNETIQSVTYILYGSSLTGIGSAIDTYTAAFITLTGFIIMYLGFRSLGSGTDLKLKSAASLLKISAIIGLISGIINLIPLVEMLALWGFVVAFIVEIFGIVRIGKAEAVKNYGEGAVTYILIGIFCTILANLTGILPFIGGTVSTVISLLAIILVFTGWIRVQGALVNG